MRVTSSLSPGFESRLEGRRLKRHDVSVYVLQTSHPRVVRGWSFVGGAGSSVGFGAASVSECFRFGVSGFFSGGEVSSVAGLIRVFKAVLEVLLTPVRSK